MTPLLNAVLLALAIQTSDIERFTIKPSDTDPAINQFDSFQAKSIKKLSSAATIPEAPERDELTVQEMSEAKDLGIKYPVTP